MTIHTMRTTTFNAVDFEQWKDSAIQSLKGKPFENLFTQTAEEIVLQPLYTKEDYMKRVASARIPKEQTGWIVAQATYALNGKQFIESLKSSIARGNEALLIDGIQVEWDEDSLLALSDIMKQYPVYLMNISSDNSILSVFSLIPEGERTLVKGAVSATDWIPPSGYTNLRIVGADLWKAHQQGADAVTELSLALSLAAQSAEGFSDFTEFVDQFFVRFAVDTHFFMEIAKFRAFRILWQAFGSAYGYADVASVPIMATTSLRSYSKLDPYVNLLRAGNETFSAVLGGADIITVHPHDYLAGPSESAIRFARNVQLVIKEETIVDKVLDPAGGSYFIETLTSELVEKAWNSFLKIEERGGYDAFIRSGALEKLLKKRREEIATGEQSLIGTNVYAELLEAALPISENNSVVGRMAEPFELLREQFGISQPKTVLLTFGELKDFKPRADFVKGFLATGGIHSKLSPAFTNADAAMEWVSTEKPDYVIICASQNSTEEIVGQVLIHHKGEFLLDVAGQYGPDMENEWMAIGLDGFIYNGQNKIGKLTAIRNNWQGGMSQ